MDDFAQAFGYELNKVKSFFTKAAVYAYLIAVGEGIDFSQPLTKKQLQKIRQDMVEVAGQEFRIREVRLGVIGHLTQKSLTGYNDWMQEVHRTVTNDRENERNNEEGLE